MFHVQAVYDPDDVLKIDALKSFDPQLRQKLSSARCYMKISFEDSKILVNLLYDTGASVSIMHTASFRKAQNAGAVVAKHDNCSPLITSASGHPMRVSGVYSIKVQLGKDTFVAPFIITNDVHDSGIVGMNIIKLFGISLDATTGTFFMLNEERRQLLGLPPAAEHGYTVDESTCVHAVAADENAQDQDDDDQQKWSIAVANETSVDPATARLVRCRVTNADDKPVCNSDVVCSIFNMAVAVTTDTAGCCKLYLPNAAETSVVHKRGDRLGNAYDMSAIKLFDNSQIEDDLKGTAQERTDNWNRSSEVSAVAQARQQAANAIDEEMINRAISKDASQDTRTLIRHFLKRYADVISTDQHDLGRTETIEHEIELADKSPVYTQQYRLPLEQLNLVKDHLAAWLRAGIVEPARSKYNSPIFCVPKKDSTHLRVVLDYRRLNAKCMPDRYSIRPVEQCIEEIGRAKSRVFSCIDLRAGFWQLPLAEGSRPNTAFTIPGVGQFQYTVAPMGLAGSPATFSRLMDLVMQDLSHTITYIDDCLVHSETEEDHVSHIRESLARIRIHGLKINLDKCIFAAPEIQYLGHTISGDGITPGKDKTAAVAKAQPPSTVKQVRSFMGLANYFRSFIPRFAVTAAPMFALTRANSEWEGGTLPSDAFRAFKALRKAITDPPILAYHNPSGKYHLYTDAAQGDANNNGGLGAALMQEDEDGVKRAVGYASRRLQKHEQNYPAFLLELQAAVYGMEFFDTHLRGRQFALYTDHKPLCRLGTVHTKTLNRLQLKMTEMFPEIRHVAGGENSVADFLSRYQGMAVGMIDASPYRIGKMQELDEELGPIKEECEQRSGDDPSNTPAGTFFQIGKFKRQWCMRQNVLMLRITAKEKCHAGQFEEADLRVAVPKVLRPEFIKEAHNHVLAGHYGEYKSLARLSQKFWWPLMSKDVADHVATCHTCQATTNKGKRDDPRRQQLQIPHGPNWRVHVDLFGPNKCADGKKRFVLVMTDAFTKIVALRTIDDKSAPTVAKAMLEGWCYTYGVPKVFVSDQGNEFTNELARAIWKALQIDHRVTTPYHPQCNASAEVFNRTMKRYLAGAIMDAGKSTLDWPLYIAPLAFAYNTSVQKAAKETPFSTMFGYDPRVPFWDDNGLLDAENTTITNNDHADEFYKHKRAQADTRRRVANNLQHAQEETARTVDKNIPSTDEDFKAGDLVWVKIHQSNATNKKFAQTWEQGTIIERLSFSTYRVRREERSRKKMATLNAQMLKPRRQPTAATEPDSSDDDDSDNESDADDHADTDGDATADALTVEAITFTDGQLQTELITAEDVYTLLGLGWTLTANAPVVGSRTCVPRASIRASAPGPSIPQSGKKQNTKLARSMLTKSIRKAKAASKSLITTIKEAAKGKDKGKGKGKKSKQTMADDVDKPALPAIPEQEDDGDREWQDISPPQPRRDPRPGTACVDKRPPPRPEDLQRLSRPSLPFSPASWLTRKAALKRASGKRQREEDPTVLQTPASRRYLVNKRIKNFLSDPPGTKQPQPGTPRSTRAKMAPGAYRE